MGSIWAPRVSRKEMIELNVWWREWDAYRRSLPSWPPKWKPNVTPKHEKRLARQAKYGKR